MQVELWCSVVVECVVLQVCGVVCVVWYVLCGVGTGGEVNTDVTWYT